MCGRFTITLTKEDFMRYLNRYEELEISLDDDVLPKYNIAPSEDVIAMLKHKEAYKVGTIKWGYIPEFIKDLSKAKFIINARSETLLEKYIFKDNLIHKRCVIFADSFYEWKNVNGRKIPYRILLKDKEIFAFAGIWSVNKHFDKPMHSAAIITTASNSFMEHIHERMPVILNEDEIKIWLEPTFDQTKHLKLLEPKKYIDMTAYEVSDLVNHAKNKSKDCILPKENTSI